MKEKIKSYSLIIVISIIVSIPLFMPNYNIYIDDGIQHVCRIMGSIQSIMEGQTFPVIMSQFCNGFGYSWNLFYSPITAYVPLLFHFITNSFILDIKIFMLIVTVFSGIAMYEFLNKVTNNKFIATLGAVFYILAPYRLNDMYVRMALSELTSFVFLPIVFHGLYTIFNEGNKKPTILIIGAVGLVLTHLIMAMYTAIICFIYLLVNFKKLKEKEILKKLLISFVFIICITSFFLLPMLEHKLNTEYEVFKPGRMERTDVLIYNKLDLVDLLYTSKGSMIFEIGLVILIGIALTPLAFNKIDAKYKKLYVFSLITGIVSVVMTLKYFPFEKLPSILKMLQFSFRMLEFSSFFLSIVACINYGILIKNFKLKDCIVISGIMLLLTVPLLKSVYFTELVPEEKLWPSVPVIKTTFRVHAGCASFEYLPSKAFEHLDYIKTRENRVYILEGETKIASEEKSGTNMNIEIKDAKGNTVLELPYIYYLGYEANLVQGENREKLNLTESENGFIEIKLENDVQDGKIIVNYKGTLIMKISMAISIISFSLFVLYACYTKKPKEVKKA